MVDGVGAHTAAPRCMAKATKMVVAARRVMVGRANAAGVAMPFLWISMLDFLSRAISMNFMQQRCHSCTSVDVTRTYLKYSKNYSRILVGPEKIRVNESEA